MVAGATSTICTNPLWVIKTRFMVCAISPSSFSVSSSSPWRGLGSDTIAQRDKIPPYTRCCPYNLSQRRHSGILSWTFTQLTRHYPRRRAVPALRKAQDHRSCVLLSLLSPPPPLLRTLTERDNPNQPLAAYNILCCSAVAKMTASLATYPHEVVRTRLQTQRRLLLQTGSPRKRSGIVRTTAKILHFEGWRGLYKGLSVNLIRTVPNSTVTMLTCVAMLYSKTINNTVLITAVPPPPSTDTNY